RYQPDCTRRNHGSGRRPTQPAVITGRAVSCCFYGHRANRKSDREGSRNLAVADRPLSWIRQRPESRRPDCYKATGDQQPFCYHRDGCHVYTTASYRTAISVQPAMVGQRRTRPERGSYSSWLLQEEILNITCAKGSAGHRFTSSCQITPLP